MSCLRMLSILALCTVISCGKPLSEPKYTQLGWNTFLKKSRAETIKLCISGNMGTADAQRAKIWAAQSMLTWLRIAATLDDKVKGRISFDCTNPDMRFKMVSGNGRSFAGPNQTTLYLSAPYGTWTHELGHAFVALGDTYRGSQAGSCGNQPQSLMCWGGYGPRAKPDQWSTLWDDDIAGFTSTYKRLFPDSVAPPWASDIHHERFVNIAAPWPEWEGSIDSLSTELVIDESLPETEIDWQTEYLDDVQVGRQGNR